MDFTVFFNTLDGVLKAKTDTPAFEASLHLPGLYGAQGNPAAQASHRAVRCHVLLPAVLTGFLTLQSLWGSSKAGRKSHKQTRGRKGAFRRHSASDQVVWTAKFAVLRATPCHLFLATIFNPQPSGDCRFIH